MTEGDFLINIVDDYKKSNNKDLVVSTIDYVTLSITRSSMPEGHICRIDYSYYFDDHQSIKWNGPYRVEVEVCGESVFCDKELGAHTFDHHQISGEELMPVERGFIIPCELLNERRGIDAIYLRVFVHDNQDETTVARSPTVKDWF